MASLSAEGALRHSILDLAPLELECMNALWPLGEASVRDIHAAMAPTRPRAYTTIMTILDRLAQKGVIVRRKAGRAWIYQPALSAEEARSHAVTKIVDGFFEGSAEALAAHLATPGGVDRVLAPVRAVAPAIRSASPSRARPPVRVREHQAPRKDEMPGGLDASLL